MVGQHDTSEKGGTRGPYGVTFLIVYAKGNVGQRILIYMYLTYDDWWVLIRKALIICGIVHIVCEGVRQWGVIRADIAVLASCSQVNYHSI